jgi:general secretion pathway protein G
LQHRRTLPRHSGMKGFTLLELLIALLIVGLLVGVVAQNLFGNVSKAERTAAKQQIDAFSKAIEAYRLDMGAFPTTEQGLAVLSKAPVGSTRWKGPYLKKEAPPDPWGNPYVYKAPGQNQPYEIISLGRDGRPGGKDEDEDITH